MTNRLVGVCAGWVVLLLVAPALAQNVTHVSPVGLTAGTTTRVTLHGEGLTGVNQLWTSVASVAKIAADAANSDKQVSFDLTLPADTPVGVHGIRGVWETGISDVRLVVVDDLPVVLESGANHSLESSQAITAPVAVCGYLPGEQSRFFSLETTEGQRLSLEVVGNRLGTGLDPLVRILAADGSEIGSHDNDEGLGYDCRFEFTFAKAGKHFLEVRDTRFQGGWGYHLRIGDFPVTRVGYPAGLKRGQPTSVAYPGRTATDVPPSVVNVAPGDMSPIVDVAVRGASASSWISLAADNKVSQLELEPNDSRQQANATTLGRTLDGRLQVAKDADAFSFAAKAGQTVYLRGETRRLGSPADLILRLFDPAGNPVATGDDQGAAEGEISYAIPADGVYVLTIEDINGRGGPQFVYRVATSAQRRDFALRPSVDRIVAPRGSDYPIPIAVERTGMGEAIAVDAELGEKSVSRQEIPAGVGAELLVVKVPSDAPIGTTSLRLKATSTGDAPLERSAILTPLLGPKLDNLLLMPPCVDTQLAVSVVDRSFFTLTARVDAPAVAHFASTPIVVDVSREKFFDEAVILAVENLPANVEVKVQPIPKGQNSVRFDVASNAKSAVGRFPILLSGTATNAGRTVRVYSAPLVLEIRPAVGLTTAVQEAKIAPGGTFALAVRAERLAGYTGPVDLTLVNLPAGITAGAIALAEGALEAVIPLTASAEAMTNADNVIVRGAYKINGQDETTDSSPFRLQVVKP